MTPLRRSMIDAMILRGFAQRTQESYVDAIVRMSRYYGRDPRSYSSTEVQAYLLHLIQDRHLSYSTVNQVGCACRFLFETVLARTRANFVCLGKRIKENVMCRVHGCRKNSRKYWRVARFRRYLRPAIDLFFG
jgi:hypothetical protein